MTAQPRASEAITGNGTVLGDRYRLDRRIGRGGMADVYAAHDEHLGRDVAVKLFRTDTPEGDDRRRVQAEIDALSRLTHPGLVTVLDAHATGGADDAEPPFLVMELITGGTLARRLTRGPLAPQEAAAMGSELAATLAYVHSLGVVHRDVKPANVLLDEPVDGVCRARLADFGVARLLDTHRMTMTGTTVGTANYLSPEQALGHDVGPAADVYSLGLVLLECLTGRLVYPGTGVEAALTRLHHQPVVPVGLGPGWCRLLCAMTARDPAARVSAAQAARELAELTLSTTAATADDAAQDDAPTAAALPLDRRTEPTPLTTGPTQPWWRRGGRRRAAWSGVGVGVAGTAVVLALTAFGTDGAAAPARPSSTPTATATVVKVVTATVRPTTAASTPRATTAPASAAAAASVKHPATRAPQHHHPAKAAGKPKHKAPGKPAGPKHQKPHGPAKHAPHHH